MRYMLLVYLDEEVEAKKSDAERNEVIKRCLIHAKGWKERGWMEAGDALHPTSTSTTVRVRDGKALLTDGSGRKLQSGNIPKANAKPCYYGCNRRNA